ncbi:hypothetical protein [Parasediminibacterium sp. JCM 36343]
MKKVFFLFAILLGVTLMVSSCSSSRYGKGCPTTNPRYFRG